MLLLKLVFKPNIRLKKKIKGLVSTKTIWLLAVVFCEQYSTWLHLIDYLLIENLGS